MYATPWREATSGVRVSKQQDCQRGEHAPARRSQGKHGLRLTSRLPRAARCARPERPTCPGIGLQTRTPIPCHRYAPSGHTGGIASAFSLVGATLIAESRQVRVLSPWPVPNTPAYPFWVPATQAAARGPQDSNSAEAESACRSQGRMTGQLSVGPKMTSKSGRRRSWHRVHAPSWAREAFTSPCGEQFTGVSGGLRCRPVHIGYT